MKYYLSEETLGYETAKDSSNSDKRLLCAGSKNVMVDYQEKVKIRPGYIRFGAENTAITEVRNAWTWNTSSNDDLTQRFYDDELEVYLGTVDTVAINAWTRVQDGWSTTKKLRATAVYDNTEAIDLQIMVNGNANLSEWSGGVAIVDSITGTTITKKGTSTFAQNRFYSTRNMTLKCVRTGTEYTYTGGVSTTTLTGIVDTTGLASGDILIQKIVTQTNKPASNRTNDTIYQFQNQIVVGSESDEQVYLSKDTNYSDFSYSAPRIKGEGALFTLTDPSRGMGVAGSSLILFCGRSQAFRAIFTPITVGSTLTEAVTALPLTLGVDQGALNPECIVSVGNGLMYLSNEVALRTIEDPLHISGINPKSFSNPIKPDFDAEDWSEAYMTWYKNILTITTPVNAHMYMLNFAESADGKTLRYWNPPQTYPVGPMSIIDIGDGPFLCGHSNAVPESYELFYGQSDGQYEGMDVAGKLPIEAIAIFSYDNSKDRAELKCFDEYYVEGEITANTTDLILGLNYDYDGSTQQTQKTIDGSDQDILEGLIGINSLAQQSLGTNPLGGLFYPPINARKFRVVFELPKEDYFQLQRSYSTNGVDRYWAITADGANVSLSKKRATNIRK